MKKKIYATVCLLGMISFTSCQAEGITDIAQKTWQNVKESVSSTLERSESAFFSRELDVTPKSRIIIRNIEGSVAIARSSNATKLFIEAEKRGKKSLLQATHISVHAKEATVTIETKADEIAKAIPVYYTITVPDSAIVTIEQRNGDIWVRDVRNPLSVQTTESGSIHIENAINSVTARALKGSISLTQKEVPNNISIFLEAYRSIDLKINRAAATLDAKVGDGLITSTIPITLDPVTTTVTKEAWRALRKQIRGTIGSRKNGATIVLDATKGPITIAALEA